MSERERNESQPDADPANPEVARSNRGPVPQHPDTEKATDQAIINEEQALDSGEENVV